MTRFADLLAAESLRLRSRGALIALLLMLPTVSVVLTVVQATVARDDYSQARAVFREDRAARYQAERANFLQMRATMADKLPASARDLSRKEFVSGRSFFGGREKFVSRRYDARTHVPQAASALAAAAALIAFTLGAVAIGRDWVTGVVAGLLVWEPRRFLVLLARLLTLAIALVAVVIVAFVLVWVGGLVDGALKGTTRGLTGAWWRDQLWFGARTGVVGLVSLVVGAALADLARNTSLPLGSMVATLVVNPVVAALLPAVRPWLPVSLIGVVLDWGQRFRTFDGQHLVRSVRVSGVTGLAVLVMLSSGLLAVAAVVRRRRDVV